jgi:hypothetical protein
VHVGIVLDPAAHTMIDAYETGYPVEEDTYGLAAPARRSLLRRIPACR